MLPTGASSSFVEFGSSSAKVILSKASPSPELVREVFVMEVNKVFATDWISALGRLVQSSGIVLAIPRSLSDVGLTVVFVIELTSEFAKRSTSLWLRFVTDSK